MDTTKFDAILDINDADFAEKLRILLDVKKGETVEIVTPQFTRTDGLKVRAPLLAFDKLPNLSEQELRKIGCQPWDEPEPGQPTLWLYPGEWYDFIPEGLMVTDINGNVEPFVHGKTDDDIRFGALAFGFSKATVEAGARERADGEG